MPASSTAPAGPERQRGRSRYRRARRSSRPGAGRAASETTSTDQAGRRRWYQVTQRGGLRCSAAVAYLHPVLERPNLTLETGAHVTRLLLEGMRARGVEIEQNEALREISAAREVILKRRRLPEPADHAAERRRPGRGSRARGDSMRTRAPRRAGTPGPPRDVDHVYDRRGIASERRERREPRAPAKRRSGSALVELR